MEDKNHDIWISTVTSIYKIKVDRRADKYSFHVISCLSEDEIRQDDLYSFPSLMTRDNQLFLGLMNGFLAFSPENMIDNQCLNRPLFTSFRLFNVPVVSGETYNGRVLFDKALSYSDEVQLKYDENYITLEFSGLNFLILLKPLSVTNWKDLTKNGRKPFLRMDKDVLSIIISLRANTSSVCPLPETTGYGDRSLHSKL